MVSGKKADATATNSIDQVVNSSYGDDSPNPWQYRLQGVRKHLEKGGTAFDLCIPELVIGAGEFVAFVGDSGCGKTTLLDMLGLVSAPTAAERFEVKFGAKPAVPIVESGESQLAAFRREYLGYVLQFGGLLPFLSVEDNIMLVRRANGMGSRPDEARAIAESLGIEEHWRKKPAFLSGGQRQRVAIARALAHGPAVVLADEPTGAVDKITGGEIGRLLRALSSERGITILFVTHDVTLVAGLAERVFTFELKKRSRGRVESFLVESTWANILPERGWI